MFFSYALAIIMIWVVSGAVSIYFGHIWTMWFAVIGMILMPSFSRQYEKKKKDDEKNKRKEVGTTLFDYYKYMSFDRTEGPFKNIESYTNPALFWKDDFRFYDKNMKLIESVIGMQMTTDQLDKYKKFVMFKDVVIINEYSHIRYYKDPDEILNLAKEWEGEFLK